MSATDIEPHSQSHAPAGLFGTRIPAIIVPTFITSASAFSGLLAINAAIAGQFEAAVLCVLVAALFDCLDGQSARMLGCTSRFGMELDSLVDFLSFGVAPAFIMYLWVLHGVPGLGFAVAAGFVLCCAYRLARFNVEAAKPKEDRNHDSSYFQGVPAPAGAACALLPILISAATGYGWASFWLIDAAFLAGTAILMISTVPTLSSKSLFRLMTPRSLGVIAAVAVCGLVLNVWATLVLATMLYLASIPVAGVLSRSAAR